MFNVIYPTTIWDFFDKFLYIFRIAAFVPYKRIREDGKVNFVASKPNIFNVGNIAVVYIIMFYSQGWRFSVTQSNDEIGYFSILIQYICLSVVVSVSMIKFLFNHSKFLEAQKLIMHVDEQLKDLKIIVSFKYWYWYHAIGIYGLFAPFLMGFVTKKPMLILILDSFAYGYPIVVRCIILSNILMHFLFLYQRFVLINQLLEQMDVDDLLNDPNNIEMLKICNEKSPAYILQKLTEIHQNLVLSGKLLNDDFSIIMFLNMLTNFVQFVFGIFYNIMGGSDVITLTESNCIIFVYTSQMTIIFATCHLLKLQSENSLALLGQLNIYYLEDKLAVRKNTFLLQGSHTKVNLTLAGLFPLNLAIFLQEIAFGNNIVLLLVQYQQKQDKTKD